MAKITDDPKVQEALAKAAEKATKEEQKRVLAIVKELTAEQVDAAKGAGEKASAKVLAQLGKDIVAKAKAA